MGLKGSGRGDKRGNGGEYDQSTLYALVWKCQWNPLIYAINTN
jgi:hypothetical protein